MGSNHPMHRHNILPMNVVPSSIDVESHIIIYILEMCMRMRINASYHGCMASYLQTVTNDKGMKNKRTMYVEVGKVSEHMVR